ncbi:MAG: hypothetical protein QXE78_03255 [Nitrososphaeria archaeon]
MDLSNRLSTLFLGEYSKGVRVRLGIFRLALGYTSIALALLAQSRTQYNKIIGIEGPGVFLLQAWRMSKTDYDYSELNSHPHVLSGTFKSMFRGDEYE